MSDKVGYGRPPKHAQFKKGVSGNPKGRPKGGRSLQSILAEELRRKVQIREGGRTRSASKLEIFVRKRVNDGIQGGTREAEALAKLILKFLPTEQEAAAPETLSLAERAILDRYLSIPDD